MAHDGWIEATGEGDAVVLRAGGAWRVADAAALDRQARRAAPAAHAQHPARSRRDRHASTPRAPGWSCAEARARGARHRPRHREPVARPGAALGAGREGAGPLAASGGAAHQPLPRRARRGRRAHGAVSRHRGRTARVRRAGRLGRVLRGALHPRRIRVISLLVQMEQTGLNALPIVGLLSFLIGVVIGLSGRRPAAPFGAEIFTVNLLGIAHPARARRPADRDHHRRPLGQRLHRADRHDAGQRGDRRDAHARPRPDRGAGAAAHVRR